MCRGIEVFAASGDLGTAKDKLSCQTSICDAQQCFRVSIADYLLNYDFKFSAYWKNIVKISPREILNFLIFTKKQKIAEQDLKKLKYVLNYLQA